MDISYSLMLPVLMAIAKACHSYGWAIILLTVIVRILVYPLVSSSTRSMQRMSQLQPQLKALQERYKGSPELFQKKATEFYQKNKINPLGGCLPTLVQLPILFALFTTFTGPPFGDKTLPIKIKVMAGVVQEHKNEVSSATSPYVWPDGKLSKVVVYPGDSTIAAGQSLDFGVRAVEGSLPDSLKTTWKITGDANHATINSTGRADFPQPGEITVQAVIPGVAKDESFGFIKSLGKVAQGMNLLKPANWDIVFLIFLFGITMWVSQKLMVQPPPANADSEQYLIQQQTQKTMPIAVTAMFFFIPLPAGVFLYMVVSNIIQSLQTWLVLRTPVPALVEVTSGGDEPKAKELEARSNQPKTSTSVAREVEEVALGKTATKKKARRKK